MLCVVGTRPEAIKMAPIMCSLKEITDISVRLLLTGQHRDLLSQALASFGLIGEANLDLMQPNQSLSGLSARIMGGIDSILEQNPPAMVLAQGDTTTVMATAIACFHRQIPFGHVEAGLRTGNLSSPFPEEFNRIVASHAASLNFAPTEGARQALLREAIRPETIHVTGNTVIDALLATAAQKPRLSLPLPSDQRLVLLTMHRRENFGRPAAQIFDAVLALCAAFPDVHFLYPVHPNPNIRDAAHGMLSRSPQVTLTEPLDYPEMVAAMQRATLVLTDSGGLQEEAPALGKPVLVMRNETERPEAVQLGVAKLIGTSRRHVFREVARLLTSPADYAAMAKGVSPYGDGCAAARIAALVANSVLDATWPVPGARGATPPARSSIRLPTVEPVPAPPPQRPSPMPDTVHMA
ncbi:non-hydrolyzing UDP-N-acetylglucosamine 2-epimerase [Siccirubricoccus deserti]|uniref:non-hydrolyzing UDP-N-acetylglucosamine 2-epimerase n=1 Tax=Siccirubricoccus deserti TaxID=2013562 RepID=UPI00227C1342|nr:UDP-N-acetylglucosamine 2-epimerase (non-hydrolyzing) [Siccirubricoccus deserti]